MPEELESRHIDDTLLQVAKCDFEQYTKESELWRSLDKNRLDLLLACIVDNVLFYFLFVVGVKVILKKLLDFVLAELSAIFDLRRRSDYLVLSSEITGELKRFS